MRRHQLMQHLTKLKNSASELRANRPHLGLSTQALFLLLLPLPLKHPVQIPAAATAAAAAASCPPEQLLEVKVSLESVLTAPQSLKRVHTLTT
jgi:hypothetical protein